jgi:FkbM family methyltransferase
MNRFYVEIGTSDFDTLNDRYAESPTWEGLSIEPVPEYFKNLKRYDKNVYRNLAVVGSCAAPDTLPIYSIASETIKKHNLPSWLRGCSALSKNNPSLQKYKEHITEHEVKTISVEKLFNNIKTHVDLLKVDTEGCDYEIVKQVLLLGHRPTHIIFETCFMSDGELNGLYALLRRNHYDFIKRIGDSVQFSRPSVLLICDADWSTGSIAKDLKHISDKWQISILDWKNYTNQSELSAIFSEFDSIICFTLNAPTAWPILKKHSVICCGEVEFSQYNPNHLLPIADTYGAVSPTIYTKLTKLSSRPVFYTPASARETRFKRDLLVSTKLPIKRIGFVGPTTPNSVKNYELFQEICTKSNTTGITAFQHYTYQTMPKFYKTIDLLLCTSTSEGGPLPVFEAIASGIPVFSTPVGLVKEMYSIPIFRTADQCVDLINSYNEPKKYLDLIDRQYHDFIGSFSMEVFLPYWEKFFQGSKYQTTVMI